MRINNLELDFKRLVELELTPNQYVLLYLLHNKDIESIIESFFIQEDIYKLNNDIYKLYQKGYIENELSIEEVISLQDIKVKDSVFLPSDNKTNEFDEFFEEWFSLWPKKAYTGNNPNFPIRCHKLDCKKRLAKFNQLHSEYTYETIISVTKAYLERHRKEGYQYCRQAHYFIYKDFNTTNRTSNLLAECEQFTDLGEVNNGPVTGTFSRDI